VRSEGSTALSPGERVARDGAFIGSRGSGEGLLPNHSAPLPNLPIQRPPYTTTRN